ncbi:biosynthesis cluster domain-containing protein [Pseudomonas sp. NFIX10]|uniref:hypothetical protein n=1 Tax=unclassified Pseudomonas TaxID=196821 RepID=UPI0008E31ADF|nr:MULTISPECIES: hypothetical protein [unclassified Pseudomonas]SFB60115.1 biosynthesis cluster domain-containing protein [Pseudomonas sp. NFIX10]SFF61035.1 biosynthesis cluster domain-containing protein [Pseudomonas sp. NFACC06-1]
MPTATTLIASRTETYLASMPDLAFTGLSENWLLKECGHQHWLALAHLHDRALPDLVNARQVCKSLINAVHLNRGHHHVPPDC